MAANEQLDVGGGSPVLRRVHGLLGLAALAAPPGLVPANAWARLASLPSVLPHAFAIAAFEVPLEAGATRLDFELCIRAAGGEREALAAWLQGPAPVRLAATDARWSRTLAFLRRWSDPASPLFDGVEVVWLEFDLEPARPPRPFIVFTLRCNGDEDPSTRDRRGAAALGAGLELLADDLPREVTERVHRCLARLRASGRLRHVAVRPVPGGDTVRLIAQIPRHRLPTFLKHVGWAGDRQALGELLERLGPTTTTQAVNLDVWREIGPRVGVEYHFPTSPLEDARWRTLFDGLVAAGACSRRKRAALARWCPPDAGAASPLVRTLLVKVLYETGQPLRAKGYLPFAWSGSLPGA